MLSLGQAEQLYFAKQVYCLPGLLFCMLVLKIFNSVFSDPWPGAANIRAKPVFRVTIFKTLMQYPPCINICNRLVIIIELSHVTAVDESVSQ